MSTEHPVFPKLRFRVCGSKWKEIEGARRRGREGGRETGRGREVGGDGESVREGGREGGREWEGGEGDRML